MEILMDVVPLDFDRHRLPSRSSARCTCPMDAEATAV